MFKLNIILLLLFLSFNLKAQQLPIYSQYMANRFLLNPARAGADGYTMIEMNSREQWLGLSGAPRTHSLAFQSRVLKTSFMGGAQTAKRRYAGRKRGGKVGIGGFIYNDRSGLLDYTGMQATYAYHVKLRNSQLSFGLSGSLLQYKLNREKVIFYDKESDDPMFLNSNMAGFTPDASFGVYYLAPGFFGGFSAVNLMQSALQFGNTGPADFKVLRTYYLMSGYKFQIDRSFQVEPSFLYKTNEKLKNQLDINVRAIYLYDYWAGLSYRTGGKGFDGAANSGALIMMAGVAVGVINIGYAFDYNFTNIQKFSYGSHELNVALRFGDNSRRYRWLERY
jgi:type IX secretion system PorP/SprF family membrane protein